MAETLIMSAVSTVSLPNYAQAVSAASAPGSKPSGANKPQDDYKVDGATTSTKNATLTDTLNFLA